MAFKNSLKSFIWKRIFPPSWALRLVSGPPAEAGLAHVLASRAPRASPAPAHIAPAQPSSARWPFSRAPRRSPAGRRATPRPRQKTSAAWRPRAGVARRAAAAAWHRAHAPAFNCQCPCARSLAPALPLLPLQSRAPELRPRRARSSAGVELSHRRAISRLLAPTAPPRLPSAHARACAAFRALGELPRASPPTSMAPPCSAAVERPLPPFLSCAWLPARFRHCLANLLRSLVCAAVAGDGRRPLAEPRRRASACPGEAPCLGWPGRARPWADALLGRLPIPRARAT